jgi:undecaprenyl-diphosphatase
MPRRPLIPGRHAHAVRELARREVGATAALLVLTFAAWAFASVAEEVAEGDTVSIDRAVLMALRSGGDPNDPIGPHWLQVAAADVTSLGSIAVLALLVLAVTGLFAALRHRRDALLVLAAALGGLLVSNGLKQLFGRERPDLTFRAVEAANPSFPSGHAMLTAVVFLTLGVLCARFVKRRRVKAYVVGIAVGATLLVGLTRIYLGVHWATDVLAGWSVGAAWAMACWLVAWAADRPWRRPAPAILSEAEVAASAVPHEAGPAPLA